MYDMVFKLFEVEPCPAPPDRKTMDVTYVIFDSLVATLKMQKEISEINISNIFY